MIYNQYFDAWFDTFGIALVPGNCPTAVKDKPFECIYFIVSLIRK